MSREVWINSNTEIYTSWEFLGGRKYLEVRLDDIDTVLHIDSTELSRFRKKIKLNE